MNINCVSKLNDDEFNTLKYSFYHIILEGRILSEKDMNLIKKLNFTKEEIQDIEEIAGIKLNEIL